MRRAFVPLTILTAAMFAYAPIAIANAPYESTMLLIQKIFYFHVPAWMAMYAGIAAIVKLGPKRGATRISAGNYGGKLGPHHYHLRDLLP